MTSREINFLARQPDTLRPQEKKKKKEQSELSSKGGKDKWNCMAQLSPFLTEEIYFYPP